MPKAAPIQTDFTAGEFSPLVKGRVDIDRYRSGLDTCLNQIPTIQGGVSKRSGFRNVADTKTSSEESRLVRFEFSVTQAYILEFGDLYIRFYRNQGQILSGGVPYEIATTYLEADIFKLRFVQSADVLFVVHEDYPPRKISRTDHDAWTITDINFLDGPYAPTNVTTTTLTPAATTGSGITVTASAITGINGDTGFQTTDVGRSIRIKNGATFGWAEIATRVSTTVVTVNIVDAFAATTGTTTWRLGAWSETTGYPSTTTFHEDRLFFGGAKDFPQRIDGSNTGDFENFQPTEIDASIIDSNALSFTFNATQVNAVRSIISDEKGLIATTVGGEWIVRPSSQSEALTPSNITAKRSTTYGSADIQTIQAGKASLFVQRAGRKVRELNFFFDVDGFRALDLTVLSEHITESGIKETAFASEPQPILWCCRNDGVLAGMTYERDIESFKAGWHRHIVGGSSDAAGTPAKIESVATIPSQTGDRDELWVIVQRYINGAVVRHVEFMEQENEDSVEQQDMFHVDSGLTLDIPFAVSAATKTNPVVVTTATHGYSNGDKVRHVDVKGMTELNGNSYLVANKTSTTYELTDLLGNNIDGTSFGTYVSGGESRKFVSNISGLGHLEGEVISVMADGYDAGDFTVASGAITLPTKATIVHAGLPFSGDGKMLRLDAGAADGTAIGKTQKTHRVGFMLHRTLGLKIGVNFDEMDDIVFRTGEDLMTRAPALFTGIISETLESEYDFENQVCWRSDRPLPCIVLAIMPNLHTQDR